MATHLSNRLFDAGKSLKPAGSILILCSVGIALPCSGVVTDLLLVGAVLAMPVRR